MPYELEHPDNDQIYSQNRPGDLTAWKTIEQLPLHLDQETYYVIACYKIFLRSAQIAHVIQRSHMISSIQDPNPEIPFGGLTCIIHYNGYPRRKISERTIDLILVDMERISHPGHRAWRCYTKWKMEGDESEIPPMMNIFRLSIIFKAANLLLTDPDQPWDLGLELLPDLIY